MRFQPVAFLTMKAAARPMMKARYGRIVNLSSVVALRGNPGQINYCASKAGLIGMTKSLAKELGGRGVTVNAVAPGYIATDMTAALPDAAREAMLSAIPAGRPRPRPMACRPCAWWPGKPPAAATSPACIAGPGRWTRNIPAS